MKVPIPASVGLTVLAYCGSVNAFASSNAISSSSRSGLGLRRRAGASSLLSSAVATHPPLQHVLRNVILKKPLTRGKLPIPDHPSADREQGSRPYHGLRETTAETTASADLMPLLLQGLPYLKPTEHAELQRALAVALRVQTDAAGTREGVCSRF